MGIIAVVCVLVLAIVIGAGVTMYPKMQVQNAVAAVEQNIGKELNSLRHCILFEVDADINAELDEYVVPATYVCVWVNELDIYFVRMEGLRADFIYDYDIFTNNSARDSLNDSFLAVFSALTEATYQEKTKDFTDKY